MSAQIIWTMASILDSYHSCFDIVRKQVNSTLTSLWVIPSEAVTEPCGHRLQFTSWSNILLISIEKAFLLKYMKYYQTGQIGVGPRTDFHQIGTLDMEWLLCESTSCYSREVRTWLIKDDVWIETMYWLIHIHTQLNMNHYKLLSSPYKAGDLWRKVKCDARTSWLTSVVIVKGIHKQGKLNVEPFLVSKPTRKYGSWLIDQFQKQTYIFLVE